MKLQPGGPGEGEADLKQSWSDRNEKDPDKRRGGFTATFSTLVQSPLDPFTEQEQSISNHTISLWDIVCKPARLILFSHTKMDTNANTLFLFFFFFFFLLFSITVILLVRGYLGIIQSLTFDSLLKVCFHCVMLKLLLK